jgi:hypothetical protein
MADNEVARDDGAVAVAERPKLDAKAIKALEKDAKKAAKRRKDSDEYEIEFATPFGKIEFELEPTSSKKRKDDEKRAKAERDEAKVALKAEKAAAKLAKKHGGEAVPVVIQRGGSKLLPILLIFAILAAVVVLAIWLFARPGEEEADVVPPEFLNEEAAAVAPPQGFVAQARQRIHDAVHAGRKASREAQEEQEQRFQGMTKS